MSFELPHSRTCTAKIKVSLSVIFEANTDAVCFCLYIDMRSRVIYVVDDSVNAKLF